ncbi:MAG: fumarylacetoacetate hydrolase family protein [Planctomycetes bacterium]|nr:fumarylacetoacetate hydrolase family protein [Planctomycetota bacterium]
MRLCRYQFAKTAEVAIFDDQRVISVNGAAKALKIKLPTADSPCILDYLAPHGRSAKAVQRLLERFAELPAVQRRRLSQPIRAGRLKVPVPDPNKVILLAGNYGAHIQEGGGVAHERADTFPYFFWKPPTTTLTDPGAPIRIPRISPDHIDWEIELGVIIGRTARHVNEKDALRYVAGYTVCNDISDRRFHINPQRKQREKDGFFDWLHGKWHDTFLPMGPCVRSAASMPDPQKLHMVLRVNGNVMQDANTGQMVFPVAALISILSSVVTLEPGDILVTGTPSGVGHARKPPIYLRPKDQVEAEIESIGVLCNPVLAEK